MSRGFIPSVAKARDDLFACGKGRPRPSKMFGISSGAATPVPGPVRIACQLVYCPFKCEMSEDLSLLTSVKNSEAATPWEGSLALTRCSPIMQRHWIFGDYQDASRTC